MPTILKVMDCRVAALLSMNRFRHCRLDPQSSVCVALDAGSRPAGQLTCAVSEYCQTVTAKMY
jgi:hypothetical protein